MPSAANIYRLGVKELWSLVRDPVMLVLIAYVFTASIYVAATAVPDTLHNVPIAFVDEDESALSGKVVAAFFAPQFKPSDVVPLAGIDTGMDAGTYTFVLDIPPNFQRDVLAGKSPTIQLNVDATRMTQAFSGSGYVQQIVQDQVNEFVQRYHGGAAPPVELALRARFNPNLEHFWFGAMMEVVNHVTLLAIILAGASLIREREHGTIEHLLVMPVTPAEIMLSKVWSMVLVVLVSAGMSLTLVVHGALGVPIEGSVALFLAGTALHLIAATAMGIYMATLVRSMPQFGLLVVLVVLPLQMLSGGTTPRESMPAFVQSLMLAAPTTHYVAISQAILYRSAAIEVVWPQFLALAGIGAVFFAVALNRFRKTISQMA
ncbi:MAG: ABC transporter permease [Gemmataceae bacterium]